MSNISANYHQFQGMPRPETFHQTERDMTDAFKKETAYEPAWKKADNVKEPGTKTVNQAEANLSEKSKAYLQKLREKYGDFDFVVAAEDDDTGALTARSNKEYSIIISPEELEKMADDEEYGEQQMNAVQKAIEDSEKLLADAGFHKDGTGENGTIKKLSITINDDGSLSMFAELEKAGEKQKERIEEQREKRAEERKAAEKRLQKNPYEKEEPPVIKRTNVQADSLEEFAKKLSEIDWDAIVSEQRAPGGHFNFSA